MNENDLKRLGFLPNSRVSTIPFAQESTPGNPRNYTVYSEDAFKIVVRWLPGGGPNICNITFTNGTTLPLHRFTQPRELVLDGWPYVKRDDIIQVEHENGVLVIERDILKRNVETPGK